MPGDNDKNNDKQGQQPKTFFAAVTSVVNGIFGGKNNEQDDYLNRLKARRAVLKEHSDEFRKEISKLEPSPSPYPQSYNQHYLG